jgi:hypothetical protein
MIKNKICLFTAHSPLSGGGGVILRSLITKLPNTIIKWCYIGNRPVPGYEDGYLGTALMGGPMLKDVWQTWQMLTMADSPIINHIVDQLLQTDCDGYWIVTHNEGLRVAVELAERQSKRPVHITIHDDWKGALCARSVRYRLMGSPAQKLTIMALNAASSFDVVSAGMQNYYKQLSGKTGAICHRYLQADAIEFNEIVGQKEQIIAGHIGSIYSKEDFISFLKTFVDFAIQAGKKPLMQMWGCHININDIPENLRSYIVLYDTLPEEKVIPELKKCTFVYCMYPLSKALHSFSATSLPTKLTSYLQAGRPILGHGPADSTLAEFITTTGLGAMWISNDKNQGQQALQQVTTLTTYKQQWQVARNKYFGEANIEVINAALNSKFNKRY